MDMSLFHIHSVGRAAANKEPKTPALEIFPMETLSYVDGEITDLVQNVTVEGEDAFGEVYQDVLKSSNSIEAAWLPFGSNRVTPPDIRRGERVLLWKYGDTDQYYWASTGLDDYLRRLETVVYAFSDIPTNEDVKALDPTNSYYFEISTHKKMITLSTCKKNGEPFAYKFQFNLEKGIVILMDDVGNYFEMDSRERSIIMRNADKSILSLDKMDALLSADNSISLKTKTYKLDCDTATTNAKTSVSYATKTVTIRATTLAGNIDASTFSGTVTIQKLASFLKGFSAPAGGGATASIGVPITATAGAAINGGLTADGKNVGSTHNHTSGAPGSPTSPPI